MQSPHSPLADRIDPVEVIRQAQRAQQRFWPGFSASVASVLVAAPVWWVSVAMTGPTSRLRIVIAALLGGLVGLPMRRFGNVSELRLALPIGGLAFLALGAGDLLAAVASGTSGEPSGVWFYRLAAYVTAAWAATGTARRELDISLSLPGRRTAGVAIAAPLGFEDPNAIVLDEVASIQRGLLAVPGQLTLTHQRLQFTDKKANVPSDTIELADIASADRGIRSTAFTLNLSDGKRQTFVVFDRDKWIVQINARLASG